MTWRYEKLDENMKIITCPRDDKDGKITGKIVLNVPAYFDENPEERKRLGWVKHITYEDEEIQKKWPHTLSQYLVSSLKQVDEWTIEDDYHVMNKSEDQMYLEELLEVAMNSNGIVWTM